MSRRSGMAYPARIRHNEKARHLSAARANSTRDHLGTVTQPNVVGATMFHVA